MRAVRHYLEAILSARSRSRRLLILAFKVQPRYLDWRERGGMKKREGGGLTMAREEERERKTTMSSNWIKISPTKGDETRGVHSFASTRTFRESKRAVRPSTFTSDYEIIAGVDGGNCVTRVTSPSFLYEAPPVVLGQVSKVEKIKRQRVCQVLNTHL